MKVLHVIPTIDSTYGGPAHALIRLVNLLVSHGLSSTILTEAGTLSENLDPRVSIVSMGRAQRRRHFGSYGLLRHVGRLCRENDVIHIHGVMALDLMLAALVAQKCGVPFIIRPHGSLDPFDLTRKAARKRIFGAAIVKPVLERASLVHCTTTIEADRLHTFGAKVRTWIAHLPAGNGLESAPTRDVVDEGPLNILFLSRLHPKKNLEGLIRAVAFVQRRGARVNLTIAGTGTPDYAAALADYAATTLMPGTVRFAGHVVGRQKATALAQADVFALPSQNENYGVAVVEALQAGVPVIVTPNVYIASEIAQHNAGVVCEDEVTLQDTIAAFADMKTNRPQELVCYRQNALRLGETVFSDESCCAQHIAMYQQAVKQRIQSGN